MIKQRVIRMRQTRACATWSGCTSSSHYPNDRAHVIAVHVIVDALTHQEVKRSTLGATSPRIESPATTVGDGTELTSTDGER